MSGELERRASELLDADAGMRAARSRWEAAVHSLYDTARTADRPWRESEIKAAVHQAVTRRGHDPFEALVTVLDRGGYWDAVEAAAAPDPEPACEPVPGTVGRCDRGTLGCLAVHPETAP